MRPVPAILILAGAVGGTAAVARADATVESKTQVQFGAVMGKLADRLGGRSAREGLVATTTVKGDRRLSVSGPRGELVDLAEEKVYRLDYASKTYTTETFANLREKARTRLEGSTKRKDPVAADIMSRPDAPQYEAEYSMKETGVKKSINGFDTRQVLATVVVRQKGRKLEDGGGAVLTAELWLGPKVPAVAEVEDFNRRYYHKLYGDLFAGDMAQASMLMATTPAFGEAMRSFQEHRAALDGSPIRTVLNFEAVTGIPAPPPELAPAEGAPPTPAPDSSLGALLERVGAGRASLFIGTNEVLKASAGATDLSLPADFKPR